MSLDRALPRPSLCFTKAPIQTKLIPKLAQINPAQIKPSPKPYSNKQRLTANMRNEKPTADPKPTHFPSPSVHRNELIRSSLYPLFKQQYIDSFVSEQKFITAHEQQLSNPHRPASAHNGK